MVSYSHCGWDGVELEAADGGKGVRGYCGSFICTCGHAMDLSFAGLRLFMANRHDERLFINIVIIVLVVK